MTPAARTAPTRPEGRPLAIETESGLQWMRIGSLSAPLYEEQPELEAIWKARHMDIPPDYLNQIITGDARQLAERIPDESVDLIFTDPVYERIEDYEWVAETAARVLKPNRACLVWCSNVKQYEVHPAMSTHLRFVLPLNYTKIAKTYAAHRYRAFLWSTPLLWFQKGNFVHNWLIDTVVDVMQGNSIVTALAPPSDTYKWHKNPEAYVSWLKAFTKPGDIVWDPFAGSGSLPVECKRMGRTFIASELKPDIAEMARARVTATPVIDPIFEPEQSAMFDAPAQDVAAREGGENKCEIFG